MNKRTELPTAENSSNFNRVAGATCQVGTTLENLKAAVCGETGASAKYAACAELAKEKGYEQLGRLWEATSAAEQVHIRLEAGLVEELEPGYERPTADAPELEEIDLNLIASANGEIFETSDMYPGFIAKAQEEGNDKAVQVFTKAKLAEAVRISRRTLRIVHQNIAFALVVKALVLALGALGMATMWEAVFADVGVMVLAILNAMRALKAPQEP